MEIDLSYSLSRTLTNNRAEKASTNAFLILLYSVVCVWFRVDPMPSLGFFLGFCYIYQWTQELLKLPGEQQQWYQHFCTIVNAERQSTWHRCCWNLWRVFQESRPVTDAMLPVHVPEAWLSGICEFLTGKQRSSHLDLFFSTFVQHLEYLYERLNTLGQITRWGG